MAENEFSKVNGSAAGMLITEAIVTLIIIFSVLAVKYFFKDTFTQLAKWYGENICAETEADEVTRLPDGEAYEI